MSASQNVNDSNVYNLTRKKTCWLMNICVNTSGKKCQMMPSSVLDNSHKETRFMFLSFNMLYYI